MLPRRSDNVYDLFFIGEEFDLSLNFSIKFDPRLNDPTSSEYESFSIKATEVLQLLINATTIEVEDYTTLTWMFREGSTMAIANNIPLLNATDEADVLAQIEQSRIQSNISDLNAVSMQMELRGCDLFPFI